MPNFFEWCEDFYGRKFLGHENHKKAQKEGSGSLSVFCVFLRLFVAILFMEMWFRLRWARWK